MNPRIKEHLFTIGFMLAVTLVFISVVSGVHLLTADAVAQNETMFLKRAIMEAVGLDPPENADAVLAWYEPCVMAVPNEQDPIYFLVRDEKTGEEQGCAFICDGAGLWGRIIAVVGLDPSLKQVLGVTFVQHNETPGLGARISETWFKHQFRDTRGPFGLVPETARAKSGEMNAITGATITSTAVCDILNELLENAQTIVTNNQ